MASNIGHLLRRVSGLSVALAVGLVVFALSLIGGGGSAVPPAGAQSPPEGTPWLLVVEIEVPFRDGNGDGRNDYSPRFIATVNRESEDLSQGAVGSCPNGGQVQSLLRGLDPPSEILAGDTEGPLRQACVVRVNFEPSVASGVSGVRLTLAEPDIGHLIKSRTDTVARAKYVDGRTTFQPNISLSGFTSAHAGETIEVEFRVRTGSRPECSLHPDQDHETWRIGTNGTTTRLSRVDLIDVPAGQTSRCSYNVIWPDVPDAIKPSGAEPTVRETSRAATGTYSVPTGFPFTPDVNFDVVVTDYDNDNHHDYGGAIIPVTFSPASGSANEGCTPANTEFRYVVQQALDPPAQGSTEPRTRVERASDSPSTLIDRPTGSQHRCTYDVGFFGGDRGPDFGVAGPRSIWRRLEHVDTPATDDRSVSGASPAAHATYLNAQQSIQVFFQVRASASAAGETFGVDVTPVEGSHEGCHTVQKGVTVELAGATSIGEANHHMRAWPRHHTRAEDVCVYEVRWASSEDDGTQFRRQAGLISILSEAVFAEPIPRLLNVYSTATAFVSPTIRFEVPPIDLNGDDDHDYSGQAFDVPIRPVSATNCTDGVTARYVLRENGKVTLEGTVGDDGSVMSTPGTALSLIGWHQDSPSQCLYTVDYPLIVGRLTRLTDAADGDDRNVSHDDARSLGVYETARRQVTASFQVVGLGVPAGTPVTVAYRLTAGSDPAACADARASAPGGWTQNGGVWRRTLLVRDDSFVSLGGLTDWPQGWRVAGDRCAYEVAWPDFEDADAGGVARNLFARVDRPAGAQDAVSDERDADEATGRVARFRITYRAWYQRPTTYFAPDVALSVPFDDDGNGSNRFAGETVTVRYARASGADGRCTLSASEVYTVGTGRGASGGVVTVDAAARLVDEPIVEVPGQQSRACSYRVSAAASSTRAAAAGGGAGQLGRVGAGSATIDANGVLPSGGAAVFTYESVFVANVDISLPDDSRDKLGEAGFEDGDSAFKNGELRVTFTRTNASPEDCLSSPRTVVFTVGDGGAPRAGDSAAEATLLTFVDQVPGETKRCEYTVEFPETISSAGVTTVISWELQDTASGTVTINRGNPRATRSYTLVGDIEELKFVSPVRIAVPADVDNNVGVYAGSTITVDYAATGGAHCVVNRPSINYQIPQSLDGGIDPVGGDPVLISQNPPAQRATGEQPCTYTATLPATINSAAGVTPAWTLNLNGNTEFTFGVETEDTTFNYVVPGTQTGGNGNTNQPANPGNTNTGNTNQPANPGGTNTGNTNTGNTSPTPNTPSPSGGGTSRRPTTGGGGGGSSRPSGGGSSGGGSSGGGGAATGPWVVAAASRVPVAVSLAMPVRDFPVGSAIEVMLNVPGTCGDDTTAFAGLPAEVGLVYALNAQSGTTAAVLASDALRLAGYAQRGDQNRDCEVRITLISAPAGCRLQSADGTTSAPTDEAGRTYVELTGGNEITSYSATPTLACS